MTDAAVVISRGDAPPDVYVYENETVAKAFLREAYRSELARAGAGGLLEASLEEDHSRARIRHGSVGAIEEILLRVGPIRYITKG